MVNAWNAGAEWKILLQCFSGPPQQKGLPEMQRSLVPLWMFGTFLCNIHALRIAPAAPPAGEVFDRQDDVVLITDGSTPIQWTSAHLTKPYNRRNTTSPAGVNLSRINRKKFSEINSFTSSWLQPETGLTIGGLHILNHYYWYQPKPYIYWYQQ